MSSPRGRRLFESRVLPWLLVTPAILVIFGLLLYPIGQVVWLSFREAGLPYLANGDSRFAGLGNYRRMAVDPELRRIFVTTAAFGMSCVVATMAMGLGVASLLTRRFRGRALLGALVLLPWAIPRVSAGVLWRWMFHDQYGAVNWALASMGATGFDGYPWFNSRLPAFFAIAVVVVWQSFPFIALSLLAGFNSIPNEVTDAARVDGATELQRLRLVTLPMLRPLVLILVVMSTIWDFKIFDQVYVMTEGGPGRSTEVLGISVWREAFASLQFGDAATIAVAMFLVLGAITAVYVRMARAEETA
jgi:N,N'-diacetylchitobiose transport system permease protein